MGKGGLGLTMDCWNRCGPAVLSYQTHWLISGTPVIVKSKKIMRKTRTSLTLTISVMVVAMMNDVLTIIILTPMKG